jgi:hypothetical protein|tara:strand:+ start:28 stop:459 length:432 start_codon:yes stop_codon:yes gene_type:complete
MKKILFILTLFFPLLIFSQYYTGQRVFSEKFPVEVIDNKQDTYIEIKNSNIDIIVAVKDLSKDIVIQHAYIKAKENYKFKNIPVGNYICMYMWTDLLGNRHYSIDDKSMDFPVNQIGGYEITMEKSVAGNLSQSAIDEDDFFN